MNLSIRGVLSVDLSRKQQKGVRQGINDLPELPNDGVGVLPADMEDTPASSGGTSGHWNAAAKTVENLCLKIQGWGNGGDLPSLFPGERPRAPRPVVTQASPGSSDQHGAPLAPTDAHARGASPIHA